MTLVTSLVIFAVSLIVGATGIYVGVRLISDSSVGFGSAVVTALLGVLVYALLGFLNIIPLIGPILLLVIWVGVINLRHPGSWGTAVAIGFIAWICAVVLLYLLATVFDIGSLSALGIPSV